MHIVVGAGIFGVSAALELRARGLDVTLVDQGSIPHPLAESTDISKAVRMDYGADEVACAQMERALALWRTSPFFHESGVMYLSRAPMRPGSFEYESFHLLGRRGHRPERMTSLDLSQRFPAWNSEMFVDGYFNPQGGWAESGRVVQAWVTLARERGVKVCEHEPFAPLAFRGDRVVGVGRFEAEHVVLCTGAWTSKFLPELETCFVQSAQPVFHLEPGRPERFLAPQFPAYGADISGTGWYGFPLHPSGVLKIAHHGAGWQRSPDLSREVPQVQEAALRRFLSQAFPELAAAAVVSQRACIYCDSRDGQFWITRHPTWQGLTVAAGGSGHAFKFAPLLGAWIADAALGVPNPELERFRWRPHVAPTRTEEAARSVERLT